MTRQPWSIALRLALLFSAIAVLILIAIGAYLYSTLAAQMLQRDDIDLLNKAAALRYLVAQEPTASSLQAAPKRVLSTVYGEGIVLRIDAAPGAHLVQHGTAPQGWNALPAVPAMRPPTLGDISDLATRSGRARAIVLMATLGDRSELRISIARERSERLAVLSRYAGDLVGALVAGAAITSFLAFCIVRHALRPLHEVIDRANDINTHRLNSRLSVEAAPAELHGLGIAFNAMLDRLEEGVQRLSGFAADLAHDMRTPVNTLMVETQVALSRPRSGEEYQALMVSNLEEYERLGRMIENTLFLARAENAQIKLEKSALEASAELERIRGYFEGLAEEAGVRLALDLPGDAVPLVAEPILFQRAVSNLISNAITHTPRDGTITLAASTLADGTTVSVSNTGPGIAPDKLEKIFERYYRADQARTAEGASAGLGLSIVRAIMLLHGGQVRAVSTPGRMTTFSLHFKASVAGKVARDE